MVRRLLATATTTTAFVLAVAVESLGLVPRGLGARPRNDTTVDGAGRPLLVEDDLEAGSKPSIENVTGITPHGWLIASSTPTALKSSIGTPAATAETSRTARSPETSRPA